MELARDKASDWAMVTAKDLGEHIQAFAIAMAELVGVEEVDRGEEPLGAPPFSQVAVRTTPPIVGDVVFQKNCL